MKMHKLTVIIALISVVALNVCRAADFAAEQKQLNNVAVSLLDYMREHNGAMPPDLTPLADYIDVARLLNAAPGSRSDFLQRYAIVSQKPTIDLPLQGKIQLLVLEVNATKGMRTAIWIGKDGLPDTGMLRENDLQAAAANAIDLQNLKPMGGVVPKTSAKVLAAAANTENTEYQERVLALAREGKLEPDPPYDPKIHGPLPKGEMQTPPNKTNPSPSPTAAGSGIKQSASSFPIVPVTVFGIIIAGVIVFFLRRKSP